MLGVVHGLVSKLSTCFMSDDVPVIANQELTSIKRSCPLATSDSATLYESYTQKKMNVISGGIQPIFSSTVEDSLQ